MRKHLNPRTDPVQLYRLTVFYILLCSLAYGEGFEVVTRLVLPSGLKIGSPVQELRQRRPQIFNGPTAFGVREEPFKTFMEVLGLGKPGSVSYHYFTSNEVIVGVMKTKSLVGLEVSPSTIEAQKLFSELVDTLGYPSKEAILRRSEGSFVPVRVDVWKNPGSGPNIWFVATNREITLAVINTGDFPIDQVFIRPDPERFFVDPTRKDTVQDIDREIIQEKTQQSQSEKVEISGVKTNFDSKQTTNATKKDNEPVTPELRIRGVTPISYLIVVIVLLVSLVTLIFLRIRKR